jgi:hypothetical protein
MWMIPRLPTALSTHMDEIACLPTDPPMPRLPTALSTHVDALFHKQLHKNIRVEGFSANSCTGILGWRAFPQTVAQEC